MGEPRYIGEKVILEGTGKWWVGTNFPATIIDVNEENGTIKVQYEDGGFKRFTADDFEKFVLDDHIDSSLDFGSRDYEWDADTYNPVTEVENELSELQTKLNDSIKERKFLEAEELKNRLRQRMEHVAMIKQKEAALRQCIHRQEFLLAAEIQVDIDTLSKGKEEGKASAKLEGEVTFNDILQKATKRALGGGLAGAAAMVVQVSSLMWMRTTMNYQYRHGTSTRQALQTLYKDGGVRRFYKGYPAAILQGPLSRFGDTAANVGILTLLNSMEGTRDLPVGVKTVFASGAAAAWRVVLMPIDTVKTAFQVEGSAAWKKLMTKQKANGITIWYHGAMGASAATFAGHYPWFATYNFLDSVIPIPHDSTFKKLARNAAMGFTSSVISDTTSNSLRVLKTYRQTSEVKVSYPEIARTIIEKDGLAGLFGRGLKTRIATNGMQGLMFSVAWKYLDEQFKSKI